MRSVARVLRVVGGSRRAVVVIERADKAELERVQHIVVLVLFVLLVLHAVFQRIADEGTGQDVARPRIGEVGASEAAVAHIFEVAVLVGCSPRAGHREAALRRALDLLPPGADGLGRKGGGIESLRIVRRAETHGLPARER